MAGKQRTKQGLCWDVLAGFGCGGSALRPKPSRELTLPALAVASRKVPVGTPQAGRASPSPPLAPTAASALAPALLRSGFPPAAAAEPPEALTPTCWPAEGLSAPAEAASRRAPRRLLRCGPSLAALNASCCSCTVFSTAWKIQPNHSQRRQACQRPKRHQCFLSPMAVVGSASPAGFGAGCSGGTAPTATESGR